MEGPESWHLPSSPGYCGTILVGGWPAVGDSRYFPGWGCLDLPLLLNVLLRNFFSLGVGMGLTAAFGGVAPFRSTAGRVARPILAMSSAYPQPGPSHGTPVEGWVSAAALGERAWGSVSQGLSWTVPLGWGGPAWGLQHGLSTGAGAYTCDSLRGGWSAKHSIALHLLCWMLVF